MWCFESFILLWVPNNIYTNQLCFLLNHLFIEPSLPSIIPSYHQRHCSMYLHLFVKISTKSHLFLVNIFICTLLFIFYALGRVLYFLMTVSPEHLLTLSLLFLFLFLLHFLPLLNFH